jgi:hypothetical protein
LHGDAASKVRRGVHRVGGGALNATMGSGSASKVVAAVVSYYSPSLRLLSLSNEFIIQRY